MYKTEDGRLFTSLNEAVIHEQQTFVSVGMTPLLTTLLSKFKPTEQHNQRILSAETIALVVAQAVVNLAEDRALIQEFQKLFAKLQLQPSQPVGRTRKRTPKKKKPSVQHPAPPTSEAAPAGDLNETADTPPPFDAQEIQPVTEQAPPPPPSV